MPNSWITHVKKFAKDNWPLVMPLVSILVFINQPIDINSIRALVMSGIELRFYCYPALTVVMA